MSDNFEKITGEAKNYEILYWLHKNLTGYNLQYNEALKIIINWRPNFKKVSVN